MIQIDGINFTSSVDGVDSLGTEIGIKDGVYGYSVSNSLVFTDEAFKYLESKLFSSCDDRFKSTDVTIKDCCGQVTQYRLNNDTVNLCCGYITGSLVQKTDEKACYDVISQNPFINDDFVDWMAANNGIQNVAIAQVTNFLQYLISFGNIFDLFDGDAFARGFYHPALNINKIYEYWALKCGLEYESSIFQKSPYNQAVLLSAFAEGPYACNDNNPVLNRLNWQNLTLTQLSDNIIMPLFNAEYRITDGKLIIERADYFDNLDSDVLYDLDQAAKENDIETPCYEYDTEDACENASFDYSRDTIDQFGNQSLNRYNDVVSWADTPNDFQRDTCGEPFNVSPGTGYNEAKFGIFSGAPQSPFAGSSYPHSLVMTNGISFLPKILVLGETRQIGDCNLRYMIRRIENGVLQYNYPMWFDQILSEPELYQRFHYINDPRLNNKCYVVSSFTFAPLNYCEFKKSALEKLINGQSLKFNTRFGIGTADLIDMDDEKGLVTVKDLRI